jgi:hypothetical protein
MEVFIGVALMSFFGCRGNVNQRCAGAIAGLLDRLRRHLHGELWLGRGSKGREAVTLIPHMLEAFIAGTADQKGREFEGCPAEASPAGSKSPQAQSDYARMT